MLLSSGEGAAALTGSQREPPGSGGGTAAPAPARMPCLPALAPPRLPQPGRRQDYSLRQAFLRKSGAEAVDRSNLNNLKVSCQSPFIYFPGEDEVGPPKGSTSS